MPLSQQEIAYAAKILGRDLTPEELAILEALWSEHCSYKSTKKLLKELPTRAPWVLVGPGRDAGAIKLFDDVALVARIESHNHPSAIDPYNGAATGVGGIIRDVLSLGAKPVLLLDALYLGEPSDSTARWLAKGIIRGISDYGNRVGVPTAAGHTWFSRAYNKQPLVNVACIGIARPENILEGRVKPGDIIVLAGNATGRDGLLGSSFASKPLNGEEEDLAAIQVGNPFLEKLLIDALQEVFENRLAKHVKDLGGGGLATAVIETAAQSRVGLVVHLDRVHVREKDLTPLEIIVSESQERMLIVPYPDKLSQLLRVLDKYGVEYSVIGYFTDDGKAQFLYHGVPVAELPVSLAVNPPEPKRSTTPLPAPPDTPRIEADIAKTLLGLLRAPRVGSKAWIYESYDWGVGGRTVGVPGAYDAAVIWLRDGTMRGLAAAVYGNPRYTRLEPFRGAALSLGEAYRRVSAVGAEPLAALDNINSGNPEKPWQHSYTEAMIKGLAWMAKRLGIPFIGGNVSLYNEDSEGKMIDPVASVLVVGRVEDVSKSLPNTLRHCGPIVLVGETLPELGGSEAAELVLGKPVGRPPAPRPELEKRVARLARILASKGLACSAHSVGLGGVAVAAAKMAIRGRKGLRLDLRSVCSNCTAFEAAFSETPARILFEIRHDKLDEALSYAKKLGVEARVVGEPLDREELVLETGSDKITIRIDELFKAFTETERYFKA
ncbi:MAG: phosphoribosylformylglycinamidine synthase subunit PurL [Pyrodictiaceae archaeon]